MDISVEILPVPLCSVFPIMNAPPLLYVSSHPINTFDKSRLINKPLLKLLLVTLSNPLFIIIILSEISKFVVFICVVEPFTIKSPPIIVSFSTFISFLIITSFLSEPIYIFAFVSKFVYIFLSWDVSFAFISPPVIVSRFISTSPNLLIVKTFPLLSDNPSPSSVPNANLISPDILAL